MVSCAVWLLVVEGEVLYDNLDHEGIVLQVGHVVFIPAWDWHLLYCELPCQFFAIEFTGISAPQLKPPKKWG